MGLDLMSDEIGDQPFQSFQATIPVLRRNRHLEHCKTIFAIGSRRLILTIMNCFDS